MIRQAMTTAAIMISRSCAMPIAVMMESSENTMSMTMIWMITQKNALRLRGAVIGFVARFHLGVDFVGRLGDQEQPAADQDDVAPRKADAPHGEDGLRQADQPYQEAEQEDAEHQRQRQPDLPRALRLRCGMRETMTDRKMTLSMPRTISSAVRVNNAAQASGLVHNSIMRERSQQPDRRVARHDIGGDRAERDGDGSANVEIARQREDQKHRPDGEQRQGKPAQPYHADRMQDVEGKESRDDQHDDPEARQRRRRMQQEQIERGDIPQPRKSAKMIVGALHAAIGEIQRPGTAMPTPSSGAASGSRSPLAVMA